MPRYVITGVWKDNKNEITHYTIYQLKESVISERRKVAKSKAIEIVEDENNIVYTVVWDYKKATWNLGEEVSVVDGKETKYLRSNHDDKVTDNLGHLIDYNWLQMN